MSFGLLRDCDKQVAVLVQKLQNNVTAFEIY